MARNTLRYDRMVQEALVGVVRRALIEVSEHGLPGNHHFYISFRTGRPGVDIPDYLKDRFPDEMTIVLQHQFYGLEVGDELFSVSLKFNKVLERLTVPFAALSSFVDPAVNFGLQFEADALAGGTPALAPKPSPAADDAEPAEDKPEPAEPGAKVVSLESFRKK